MGGVLHRNVSNAVVFTLYRTVLKVASHCPYTLDVLGDPVTLHILHKVDVLLLQGSFVTRRSELGKLLLLDSLTLFVFRRLNLLSSGLSASHA